MFVYHGYESLMGARLKFKELWLLVVVFSSLALWPQHSRYCVLRAEIYLHCFMAYLASTRYLNLSGRQVSCESLGCCSDLFVKCLK